jgi:uncharacterized membrane protein YagU involved in acid resistance
MQQRTISARSAVLLGGFAAGTFDLAAVCTFWAARDVPPVAILQSIASAGLGEGAFNGGAGAAMIGLVLHFGVSFVFAAAWVVAASHVGMLRSRPAVCGVGYGIVAYLVMTFAVVPLSLAEFGAWPPALLDLAASAFIHLFLFGLLIALVASRMRVEPPAAGPHRTLRPTGAILLGVSWRAHWTSWLHLPSGPPGMSDRPRFSGRSRAAGRAAQLTQGEPFPPHSVRSCTS